MGLSTIHPSTPLVSGLITALAFMAGATAFELGRTSAAAETPVAETPTTVAAIETLMPVTTALSTIVTEQDPRPVVALVIDDAGVDPTLTRRAMALNIPLTMSFLPYAAETPTLAVEAKGVGHDVFLHMPMEPNGLENPGPGALTRYLSADEMARRVNLALSRVPGAIGLNNHMGSAFTADASAMRNALSSLAGSDLIFLDSLTSGRSRAGAVARDLGLRTLRRDIFIDHDAGAVSAMLDSLVRDAQQNGHAIAIGHPRIGSLEALEHWLRSDTAQSVRFVTMQDYVGLLDQPGEVAAASNETMGLFGGAE